MSPHVKHLALWKQKLLDGKEAWEEWLGQLRAGERQVQEEGVPWQMRHPREKPGVADKGRQRPLSLAVRGFCGGFSPPAGEGNGTPLPYSCLENPMDRGAWWAAVHGVAKGRTRLSDFTFTFHFPALEKEMATHSSVLAWRIPGTGEPGGLSSLGSHRVGHD